MSKFRERLDQLFRVEGAEYDVDVCRIVFYLLLLWWFWATPFERYAEVPASMYSPPLIQRWLGLPGPQYPWIVVARWLWLGSLLFSMLGLFSSLSTRLAFLLGFYLLGLDWSYGNTHHSHHLIILCLFTLACSRTAQYISADRLLARKRGPGQRVSDETWCLRVCQLCWCLLFFNAGVAKLRHSGLEFLSGQNFQSFLVVTHNWYARGDHPLHDAIRSAVFNSDLLAAFLGGSGLLLELLAPLAFFLKGRWRWAIILGLGMLQVGAYFLFYISEFKKMSAAYVFWLPWTAMASWVWQRLELSETVGRSQEAVPAAANSTLE